MTIFRNFIPKEKNYSNPEPHPHNEPTFSPDGPLLVVNEVIQNPYKWPYKWITGFCSPLKWSYFTLLITRFCAHFATFQIHLPNADVRNPYTASVLHLDQAWSFPISHWLVEAMLLTLTDVHRAVTPNYLAPGRGFPVTVVFGNFSGWIRLFEVSLFEPARSFCWKNVGHIMKQAADSFLNFFPSVWSLLTKACT